MKDADKTIAQIFWQRVAERESAPLFIYHQEGDFPPFTHRGRLRTMSWGEVGRTVKDVGMGLMALGARKNEAIAIMANTGPEWVMADLALLSIGGRTGSIYPNNLAQQAQRIINDLDARFVFVEGADRRDALLALRSKSPQIEKIITIGCDAGQDPLCMTFEDLRALGAARSGGLSAEFDAAVAAGRLSDIASLIFTSGTTGEPKGAMHTHESITYTVCTGAAWLPIEPGWTDLSFLPMAHIFEQFAGPLLDIYRGDVKVAFARSMDTVARDFGLLKPHFCRTAPRFFEKVYSAVWSKTEVLAEMTAGTFKAALAVSRRVVIEEGLYGRAASGEDRKNHARFQAHNYRHILDLVLGGNLRFFVSGGAPLSRGINEFFWCLGVPIYELYGMTETGGATTNRPGGARPGTVGQAWPSQGWPSGGGRTQLSPEGEIIMKGPNVMVGYHNRPGDTAKAVRDGWMHSGDVAVVDADGFFTITDRIKDIIITAGGKNVAPLKIEGLLKEAPLISQALVYGDREKFLTALVTLDAQELRAWADAHHLDGTYAELAAHPRTRAAVEKIVQEKNAHLARYETIKDFVILDHDFSIANGDLTPTLKVKRKHLNQKYGSLLKSLYRTRRQPDTQQHPTNKEDRYA